MRYFGQTPDYWLDTCTLHDWLTVWGRNLANTPPADEWAAAYFKHEPPSPSPAAGDDDPDDAGEWDSGLPEETE